jgi:UDP-N-acetylmuramate-alanine ligase
MRLAPDSLRELGARLDRGSILISATNGKTTTAAMTASILEHAGISAVHNQAGANMAGGIATTLLGAARRGGGIDGELGLFEVDEMWLAGVASQLQPRAILLSNLFRDQLDRYGELETIADSWERTTRSSAAELVLNADDPLVADLGREREHVLYFGVNDSSRRTQSTAVAAGLHTSSTRCTSGISATTTAPPAAGRARLRRSSRARSSSRVCAPPA